MTWKLSCKTRQRFRLQKFMLIGAWFAGSVMWAHMSYIAQAFPSLSKYFIITLFCFAYVFTFFIQSLEYWNN